MKKFSSYLLALFACASLNLLTSCGEDAEDPATPLPPAEGTVKISFSPNPNFTFAANGDASISAASGDVITVSVIMEKAADGTKPQKLRIWEATAPETRGTQVKIEGQGNSEGTIDLRTSLDIQKKTVDYPVTQSSGTIYLYFEVDESQDKFSRRLLTINVGSTNLISTFPGISLGAQGNAAASRMASATGDVYTACDVEENLKYVDIVYLVTPKDNAVTPRLLSNTQLSKYGFSTSFTAGSGTACSGSTINVNGGMENHFKLLPTSVDFSAIDDEASLLEATNTVTTSDAQDVELITEASGIGRVYGFINGEGKRGVIKINSITKGGNGTYASGTLGVDIKVQR